MKNSIFLFFMLSLFVLDGKSQKLAFSDDFESYSPFVLNSFSDNWISLDLDQQQASSVFGFTFLEGDNTWNKSDVAKDFVVINSQKMKFVDDEIPDYIDYSAQKGNQSLVAFSSNYQGDVHSNDWIITRNSIELGASGNVFTFWIKAGIKTRSNHHFRVLVTTEQIPANVKAEDFSEEKYGFKPLTGKSNSYTSLEIKYPDPEETVDVTDFSSLYDYIKEGNGDQWVQVSYSLDDFAGKKVYIAIQHIGVCAPTGYVDDMPDEISRLSQVFLIDNVEVWTGVCGNLGEVTDIKTEEVSHNSATISWKGEAGKYRVVYGKQWFTPGEGDTIYVEEPRAEITRLDATTQYDYFVSAYCENSEIAAHALGKRNSFETGIEVLSPVVISEEDYFYGFEDGSGDMGLEVAGWSWLAIENNEWHVSSQEEGHTGTHCARLSGRRNAGESWLFSRGLYLEAGQQIQVEFYYDTYATFPDAQLEVYIGMDNTPEAQTNLLWKNDNLDNTVYVKANNVSYSGNYFTVEETGVYYVGFGVKMEETSAFSRYLYIDDFSVRTLESIQKDQEYKVIYEDTFEDADKFQENWTVSETEVARIEIEGLNVNASGLLNSEEAEGTDKEIYDFSAYSGNQSFVFLSPVSGTEDTWLILSEKTLGITGNALSFMAKSAKKEVTKETFRVWMSKENPADHLSDLSEMYPLSEEIDLQDYTDKMYNNGWVQFLFDLDVEDYTEEEVYIVIQYIGNEASCALLIDDVAVRTGTCDAQVHSVEVEQVSITASSAKLKWNSDSGMAYDIIWGKKGFDLRYEDQWSKEQSLAREFTLEGLEENTEYDFYVRILCDENQYSERTWVGPYTFSTGFATIELPYKYDFENGNYGDEGWRVQEYLEGDINPWSVVEDGEDNKSLLYTNPTGAEGVSRILLRPITIPSGKNIRLTVDYRAENVSKSDKVEFFITLREVILGVEIYDYAAFVDIRNMSVSTSYQQVTGVNYLKTDSDKEYFFGFNADLSHADAKLFLDNIVLEDMGDGVETDNDGQSSLLIYPNPAADVINVSLPTAFNEAATTVVMSDMTGKQVKVAAYQSRLDVSDLTAGIYTITVSDGMHRQNKSFIKK